MTPIERYVRSIRNPKKREYAQEYLAFVEGRTARASVIKNNNGLSAMAAQSVRFRIIELMAAK